MTGPLITKLPIEMPIIFDSITFTKQIITKHYKQMEEKVEIDFRKPIQTELQEAIEPLNNVENFLKDRLTSSFLLFNDDSERKFVFDIVSSCLKVYRFKLRDIQARTQVHGYDELINRITETLEKHMKSSNSELFRTYAFSGIHFKVKPTKIFISYQQKDVNQACLIQDIIVKNSILKKEDVFVAHRDILLTEEWRKKMIEQLESSTHLLALCTDNYFSSAFGNQEVGYAIAKKIKVTPIFWKGAERSNFGFLESYQSLSEPVDEANLEQSIKRILIKLEIEQRPI